MSKPGGKKQCLGSGFWLPGSRSGSSKICGSMDPDPRGKISTKNCKKKLHLKPKSELLKKRDYTNFLISEWFIKF